MREAFVFYSSFYEAIKDLPAEEYKKTMNALCEYALNDNKIEVTGLAKLIITMAKPQIDANIKRYENGKKGGRPKKKPMVSEEKTNGYENEKPMVLKSENYTFENKKPKEKEKEKVKVKDKEKDKEKVKEKKKVIYGSHANVKLTDDEFTSLTKLLGEANEVIEYLSDYKEMTGKKYKSDYLAIKKWVIDAVKERRGKGLKLPDYAIAQKEGTLTSTPASKETIMRVKQLQEERKS